jgi:hypothetical protein
VVDAEADAVEQPIEEPPRSRVLLSEDTPGRPLVADEAIEQAIVGMERALEDEPVVDEPSPDATQALSRETVDRAMIAPPQAEVEPSPDATQVIPREAIEAAVTGDVAEHGETVVEQDQDESAEPEASPMTLECEPADEELDRGTTEPDLATTDAGVIDDEIEQDDWPLPPEVDQAIARFNAAQRVVYRTIRAEVGAGAANFIRSCCSQIDGVDSGIVAGVDLNTDGSWETDGLRQAVRRLRSEDPWLIYQRLIEGEIDHLRQFIGDAKAIELQEQVAMVEQADARP